MADAFEYDSKLCFNISGHFSGMFYKCKFDANYSAIKIGFGVEELSGYERDEFFSKKGITLDGLVHPDDRTKLRSNRKAQLEAGAELINDFRIVKKSGDIVQVEEVSVPHYEDGKLMYLEGFIRRMPDLSQRMIELEKHKLDFSNILENISDGLILDNIKGKVVFANDQFLNLIGIEREELNTFVFDDYVAPEYKGEVRKRHVKRMNGEDVSSTFEYIALRKDGSRKWFEARVTTIRRHGKIIGTQSAIRDINEEKESLDLLKASETEKTNLLNELNQRYNELMQFNYIVSHNLRAPIANIMGLSEMFNMDSVSGKEKVQIITYIQNSIHKIDELITDLNVILATRSDIHSKKEKVKFEDMLQRVQSLLETQIHDSSTRLDIQIDKDANEIFSIRSYIKSCLYNLINNAIKYRSADVAPLIQIRISKKENWYTVQVIDNGIGIDLKRHGKDIFGLYKRFHPSFEGKGLGLNMTKTQIESLGGNIQIESEPGKGTAFTIRIPESEMQS